MRQERVTNLSEILAALCALGGQASLSALYQYMETRGNLPYIQTNANWRQSVSTTIQRHSSDTQTYDGAEDLFYSVNGLGSGIWGLRDQSMLDSPTTYNYFDHGEYHNETVVEGAKRQITVNRYERNPSLRRKCIEKYGTTCRMCGFTFEERYGPRGKDFIEVHHVVPLHTIGQNYTATPDDLMPVCSNCHSIIHRYKPFLTREEIESFFSK